MNNFFKISYFWVIVFCILVSAGVEAFEVKYASELGPQALLKWDLSQGPIAITLNSAGTPDVPISSVESAVNGALNAWQNIPGQPVRFSYSGKNNTVVSSSDKVNSIQWVEQGWAYPSSVLAMTLYSYYVQDPPYLVDADIVVNGQNFNWSTQSNSNSQTADIQQVLEHEIGHLLGFSHTPALGATMYPFLGSQVRRIPSHDEIAAEQFLYNTPAGGFSQITPIANAVYQGQPVAHGLPLPVFRWAGASNTNFVVEFSSSPSFSKKISFSSGSNNYLAISAAQESSLEKLSPGKKIYWRVVSGSVKTTARTIIFKL